MKIQGWICLNAKADKKKLLEFLKKEGFKISASDFMTFDCNREDVFILGRNYPTQFEYGTGLSRSKFVADGTFHIYRTNKEYSLKTLFSKSKLMETE